MVIALSINAFAQKDKLPKDQEIRIPDTHIKPDAVKVGETVCVFPVIPTKERHVWVSPKDFSRGVNCTFSATRIKGGWLLDLKGIRIQALESTDAELQSYGWVRMTEIKGAKP